MATPAVYCGAHCSRLTTPSSCSFSFFGWAPTQKLRRHSDLVALFLLLLRLHMLLWVAHALVERVLEPERQKVYLTPSALPLPDAALVERLLSWWSQPTPLVVPQPWLKQTSSTDVEPFVPQPRATPRALAARLGRFLASLFALVPGPPAFTPWLSPPDRPHQVVHAVRVVPPLPLSPLCVEHTWEWV